MKYTVFSAFVFLFAASSLIAQTSGQFANNGAGPGGFSDEVVRYSNIDIATRNQRAKVKLENVQGSAYTSKTFLPGKLYYNSDFEGNILYRYNAYMEEIEIKPSDNLEAPVSALNKSKSINVQTPNGKILSFKTFIDKSGLTQNGYLTELKKGKFTLYERVDVKYTEGQKAQNSFVPAIPAKFSQFTEYYVEVEGEKRIDQLELKPRKLLNLVEEKEKSESLKLYLKENKINLKNKRDLLTVLDFLNGGAV
ncbi:MAG: hypothetical protein AAGF77_09035 [Bacteroidota bacterium]